MGIGGLLFPVMAVLLSGCALFGQDEVEREAASVEGRLETIGSLSPEKPGFRSLTESRHPYLGLKEVEGERSRLPDELVSEAGVVVTLGDEPNDEVLGRRISDAAGISVRIVGAEWLGAGEVDRVPESGIETYEQLAEPEWKGRICTRSGKHVYNVALFASMIAHHGAEKAEAWLAGLKSNLARRPQGNDRAQVKAIHAGQCDLSIGNHYYYQKMLDDPKQKPWADSVRVVFPNQAGRGAHVNISGASLVKGAPNRANAVALLEFLSGKEGQGIYARVNGEYPVSPDVAGPERLASFKPDTLSLARVAELREEAGRMADRVDYDG